MWFFQVLDPDSVITFFFKCFRIQDDTRLSFTVISIYINKFSPHDLSLRRSRRGSGDPRRCQGSAEACGEHPGEPGAAGGAGLRRGPLGGPGCHRGHLRGAQGGSGGDAGRGVPGGRQGGGALGDCVAAPQASPPGLDQPRAKAIPAPHRARRKHRAGFRVHRGLNWNSGEGAAYVLEVELTVLIFFQFFQYFCTPFSYKSGYSMETIFFF
jgi:hypothetical protein